ncbi:MAG: glycosyltransferase [Candidatus Sumerlaeia bacterium]|nr:glycosyltransferase [Candidatus Sumerlaeia bacterium]
MRRVLMICYDFPPSSVGIWRTLKFCRYMGEFGWEPSILTVKPVRSARHDWGAMEEVPSGTEIRRTESLDPQRLAWVVSGLRGGGGGGGSTKGPTSARGRPVMELLRRWVFLPDQSMGWIPFATLAARRWLRREQFDAVYTTSFPHSAHVVGSLAAGDGNLPWLADFRDIWIGNADLIRPATPLHHALHRRLESRVVHRASKVLSATEPITRDFISRYPQLDSEKFQTLTNGFDPADFPPMDIQPPHDPGRFTITYAGTLFGTRSPIGFFRGVRLLLKKEPRWRGVLRLRFLGSMIEPHRNALHKAGLADITTVENYLPHEDAIRAMCAADALLLLVSSAPGNHIMLTQKVFEYAAARRPILGLVPEGAARDFLRELNEGEVAAAEDVRGIARAIRKMLLKWEREGRVNLPENPVLPRYHRRELTRRFCGYLDEITDRSAR